MSSGPRSFTSTDLLRDEEHEVILTASHCDQPAFAARRRGVHGANLPRRRHVDGAEQRHQVPALQSRSTGARSRLDEDHLRSDARHRLHRHARRGVCRRWREHGGRHLDVSRGSEPAQPQRPPLTAMKASGARYPMLEVLDRRVVDGFDDVCNPHVAGRRSLRI